MSVENSKKKILIIEDEATQRILSKEFLESAGYSVRLSDDGKHGLNMAMKIKPDLIMLDLMLPSLDGYSLCRFLKDNELTANIPIILVTASKEPDVIQQGLEAGADDFVTKPVDWQFLKDRVSFVLSQVEQKQAVDAQLAGVRDESELAERKEHEKIALALQSMRNALDDTKSKSVEADESHAQEMTEIQSRLGEELSASKACAAAEMSALKAQHSEELQRVRDVLEAKLELQEADFVSEVRSIEEQRVLEVASAVERAGVDQELIAMQLNEQLAFASDEFDERIRAMWTVVRSACAHYDDVLSRIVEQETSDDDTVTDHQRSERLVRQIKYLAHSIGRLDKLAAVDSESVDSTQDVFDARAFLLAHVEGFEPVAAKCSVSVAVDENVGAFEVCADMQQIRYAFGLLSLHALKATPESGEITFSASVGANGETRFSVSDAGDGVPADICHAWSNCLDTAWEKPAGESCVGNMHIPTAAAIARKIGGSMEVKSDDGEGTLVTLVIPPSYRNVDVERKGCNEIGTKVA